MASLDHYRDTVETILSEHAAIPYSHGDFRSEVVFDRNRDRYLLMLAGWDRGKRVHGALVHVDIINGKFWIQRDGTEDGIATELVAAGIPKEDIVLAFKSEAMWRYTEFAVA